MTTQRTERAALHAHLDQMRNLGIASCALDYPENYLGGDAKVEAMHETARHRLDETLAVLANAFAITPATAEDILALVLERTNVDCYDQHYREHGPRFFRRVLSALRWAKANPPPWISEEYGGGLIVRGPHDCSQYGCHRHSEDDSALLYDGDDLVGFRD